MIANLLKKNRFTFIFFVYLFLPLNPTAAGNFEHFKKINMLVNSCYQDIIFCNEALFKIHIYQKNAATNKKFSCQTRLLGLEANIIMAMNSNYKKKEAKSIIHSLRKYC